MKYEVIIYWSDEDQAFIAEVPELPGCAADGETYQEAVQNVEIIMQQWIETAQEIGRSVPQPKGRLRIKDMSLVKLLNAQQHEHILDLGCGNGEETQEIAKKSVARVVGIDRSECFSDKWDEARKRYKNLEFQVMDATNLEFNEKFDAVFSNLVIHLIKPPEQVISSVWNALKPGGRFVAEFYGHGTAEEIILALKEVMSSHNYSFDINNDFPWYLPTQERYCNLLKNQGFEVSPPRILLEERGLGYDNIVDWLTKIRTNTQNLDHINEAIFEEVQNQVHSKLSKNNTYFVNYQHIIIVARKYSQLSNNN